jgi:hypothetical protein
LQTTRDCTCNDAASILDLHLGVINVDLEAELEQVADDALLAWIDVSGALEVNHSREELEARSSCSLCERGRPSRRLCERGRHSPSILQAPPQLACARSFAAPHSDGLC